MPDPGGNFVNYLCPLVLMLAHGFWHTMLGDRNFGVLVCYRIGGSVYGR
jgi:hypothetical protein